MKKLFFVSLVLALNSAITIGVVQTRENIYNVRDFGAIGDGKTLNTQIIQKAIDACAGAGGGTVYFPPGNYLSGTILIRDNVTLYLEAGATIWGSKKREDYSIYGYAYENMPSLICADRAENIAIRGRGTIDGNGKSFWKKAKSRWVIGEWRPGSVLRFSDCKNLLLEDITVRNTPFWSIHPIDCESVTIRGIRILNGVYAEDGVNTDGINPDACSNVRISDCYIQGGDDCIAMKVEKRPGSGKRACRDITITNCVLFTSETAIKIGSNTYGEFRNITVSNCVVKDAGCGIGIWARPGGIIDGMVVNNIAMTLTNGGVPIFMWLQPGKKDNPTATVKNISISNIIAVADGGFMISGTPEKFLEGITLDNIRIFMRGAREKAHHDDPPYPFPVWQHMRSPYDIFCRYVNDLKLRHIQITWNTPERPEWRSAIRCWHVNDLEIDGFVGRQSITSDAPSIWLKNVNGALVQNSRALSGTGTFLKMDEGTKNVTLMNNDLSGAKKMYQLEKGIDAKELFASGNRPPCKNLPKTRIKETFTFSEQTKTLIKELQEYSNATEEIFSVAFSPDGKILASGGADYTIKLWDVKSGKKIRTLWGHTEEIFHVAFSPDGKTLASASDDCIAKLWDLETGKKTHTLPNHHYYVWSVAFSPDGKTLATSNYDSQLILWDVKNGREIQRLQTGSLWTFSIAFSPDGKKLAFGCRDKTPMSGEATKIRLWDVAAGKEICTLPGHSQWIWSIVFSPDGKVLASASEDKKIKLWDVATGKEIQTISGHNDEVVSVAFSPDGMTLASASKDKTIKLWDITNGKEKAILLGHTGYVWSVAFSPDGKILASGSADEKIKLWDIVSGKEMRTLTHSDEE